MSHDPEVTARIDHLLRADPRLSAAAPLIGRVPAVVTDPKPPRSPRKSKPKKRPPPNIVEGEEPIALDEESDDDEAPAKPSGAPPWLKVAQAKVVSPKMRAALGAEALAYVEVDGWLWGQLTPELRDCALILAVRGLRWEERESDGADLVKRERAPLQCHPDTVTELSELVAALTEDPEAAARESRAAESMGAEPLSTERKLRQLLMEVISAAVGGRPTDEALGRDLFDEVARVLDWPIAEEDALSEDGVAE